MSGVKIRIAGPGEKVQYMVHDFNDNTIRFVLHYPGIVDADILYEAAKALTGSVDILHASFYTDSIGAYWNVNKEYDDSSFFQLIETDGDPDVTAYSLSLIPITPEDQTRLRCYLVQGRETSSIALTVSHLCVDGGDGKYLLGKLAEAYRLIRETGFAKGLAVKNGSRSPEQVYKNISPKEFLSLIKNPVGEARSEFPYPQGKAGRAHMVQAVIPASVMGAARSRAKALGATVNDILLAACYRAYAALPGVEETAPMSIMSMMDLRRHCKDGESEGLCNMSGTLPTSLPDGVQGDFTATLKEIAAQTGAAKENPLAGMEGMPLMHGASRTMPMGLLLQIAGRVYGSMSIGLTNLGNVSSDSLALGELVPDRGVFGGPLKKKPAMQVSAISLDGCCSLCVVGQYTQEDGAILQGMLDSVSREIQTYAG